MFEFRKLGRPTFRKVAGTTAVVWCLLSAVAGPTAARAESNDEAQRAILFRQSLKHPQDVSLALAYADACLKLQDYEGAIGALERVLFFAPNDGHLKAELGLLYAHLQSYELAKQYLDAAQADPALDETTRGKIAALEPTMRTAITGNYAFAFIQAGVRYQTNAAFNPDNNILRLSNQDYTLLHPKDRGPDTNGFQTVQLGFDRDLGNQRGDTLEFRLTGYATEQSRFTDLNVGLYDLSIGPRFKLAPEWRPDWTIKPYVVGGQAFLAGSHYLTSGGAGVIADLPMRAGYLLEPGVEVRRLQFANVSVFSSLNTGYAATTSLTGSAELSPKFAATARFAWTRDAADAAYQTSSSFAEEFALVDRFSSLIPGHAETWSASPYLKLLQTNFDAPNPFVDTAVTRRDSEIQVGLVLDTPITRTFTIVSNVQFAKISSNISSYRLSNFSVLTGPAVRF